MRGKKSQKLLIIGKEKAVPQDGARLTLPEGLEETRKEMGMELSELLLHSSGSPHPHMNSSLSLLRTPSLCTGEAAEARWHPGLSFMHFWFFIPRVGSKK